MVEPSCLLVKQTGLLFRKLLILLSVFSDLAPIPCLWPTMPYRVGPGARRMTLRVQSWQRVLGIWFQQWFAFWLLLARRGHHNSRCTNWHMSAYLPHTNTTTNTTTNNVNGFQNDFCLVVQRNASPAGSSLRTYATWCWWWTSPQNLLILSSPCPRCMSVWSSSWCELFNSLGSKFATTDTLKRGLCR